MSEPTLSVGNNTVAEAIVLAMETFAFVSAWPTDDRSEPVDGLYCAVEYTGEQHGRLCMIAPKKLGWTLAANVFSQDIADEGVRDRGPDALREIMNVACGALCRQVCPGAAVELNLPICRTVEYSEWRTAMDRPGVVVLEAEENIIAVWLEGSA